MNDQDIIEVEIKRIVNTVAGCGIFLGTDEKVFVIYIEPSIGAAILMQMQHVQKPRPLTHDLIGRVFHSLGVSVRRVVINDLKNNTFYARLFLKQENELGKKLVEIDARPSDCITIAKQQECPICVTRKVFDQVEDVSSFFQKDQNEFDA